MTQPHPQSGTGSASTTFKLYFLFEGDRETTRVSIASTARVSDLKELMVEVLKLDVRASQLVVLKVIYIESHTLIAVLKPSISLYVTASGCYSRGQGYGFAH